VFDLTRRRFLKAASATAAAALAGSLKAPSVAADDKSLVVEVRSGKWRQRRAGVDASAVARMVAGGMQRLTGKSTPEAAWKSLFSPREVVGLKFNRISSDFTGANQALVDAIAAGLLSAGLKKQNIIVVEAADVKFAGGEPRKGWAGQYDFGSGKTRLSDFVVNQVDAVINVPNLKHHPLAAFTGCLKNLSHSNDTIMEGPGRFHGNACNPYIADICAIDVLRKKVRLHLMNGLKGIFSHGAYPPAPQYQWFHDALLLSFDPVAIDTIGAELVDRTRAEHEKHPVRRDQRALRYLETAAQRGLGTNARDRIHLASLTV